MKSPSLPPRYNGTDSYIYFSFSPQDADAAFRIIRAYGTCRVWYDFPRNSTPEEIKRRIEKAALFICILSPHYLQDRNCAHEHAFARSVHANMIPISLSGSAQPALPVLSLAQASVYDYDPKNPPEDLVRTTFRDYREALLECSGSGINPFSDGKSSGPSSSSSAGCPDAAPAEKAGFLKRLFSGRKPKQKDPAEPEEKQTDTVNFSVLSPRAVKPDSYGVIDLHMYTEAQREVVERAIREREGLVSETSKGGFSVRRETSVTARLESEDAEIKDPLETRIWNGNSLRFDFRFYVPETYSKSQLGFTCYIEFNGIPVTRLNFITAVSKLPDTSTLPAKVTRSDFKKAFISYSRRDEQRMLARVLGIRELAPEMKFWLDKQSLDAGDLWRDEIRQAIDISDILLLFWSVSASRSGEVEKEWRYGLERNGLSFIAPVPLDPPDQCPPPEALSALNFTVRSFSRNEITEKLSFYNSRNIELL